MSIEPAEIKSITHDHIVPFPQYKQSKISIVAPVPGESILGLMLVFTIYPKTETISVEVNHDVSVSTGIWSDPSLDVSMPAWRVLERATKVTLYGIIDELGGALHININTALIKCTQERLLDTIMNLFSEYSFRTREQQ